MEKPVKGIEPERTLEPWRIPGPEKDIWKADGNRYTAAELAAMEKTGGMTLQDWPLLEVE